MLLSRTLKLPGKLNCALNEIARLMTGHVKFKKKNVPKNNFIYRNEFKEYRENANFEKSHKLTSSDLIQIENESIKPQTTKKKSLPTLEYKGEILFGIHPVYLALCKRKRHIYQLFLRTNEDGGVDEGNLHRKKEIESMANENGIPIRHINTKGMKYLALGVVHQGVCVDCSPLPLKEWSETENESQDLNSSVLWLVLDKILDPMNVGAIIRSAYYFGVDKLFVVQGNSCRLSPIVSKASSGALEIMDIYQIEKLEDFIQARKKHGWNIISTLAYCEEHRENFRPAVDSVHVKIMKPTILILGNEGSGISPDIEKLCDSFISISPKQDLQPGIDSLNVSVAAGVILHAISSQKQKKVKNS